MRCLLTCWVKIHLTVLDWFFLVEKSNLLTWLSIWKVGFKREYYMLDQVEKPEKSNYYSI